MPEPIWAGDRFEFSGVYGFEVEDEPGRTVVQLPHSCDEWVIADGVRPEALAELRQFIAEAEAVAAWLEAKPEGVEHPAHGTMSPPITGDGSGHVLSDWPPATPERTEM